MKIMEEINEVFPLLISKPNFVCKVNEDNQSCIKMATGTKFSSRTKHIALKYHHFRSHVKSRRVDIHYRPTGEQLAYLLTKPLSNESFFTFKIHAMWMGLQLTSGLVGFTGFYLSNTTPQVGYL